MKAPAFLSSEKWAARRAKKFYPQMAQMPQMVPLLLEAVAKPAYIRKRAISRLI